MKLKLEIFITILVRIKKLLDFSNYSNKSKCYCASNALVVRKMNDEIGKIAIEKLLGLKLKMYSILVNSSSEYKKAKDVDNFLLNKKCLRHSMNRYQSINHRIRTYEINKISLFCFDEELYILNYGTNKLDLSAYS